MDFTLTTYRDLLNNFQEEGYCFYTFEDWYINKPIGKVVILRHDIDKRPESALKMALLEKEEGVVASYFFLIKKSIFNIDIIKYISALGHEIGYHYRDLVDAKGKKEEAILSFEKNLSAFRLIAPIRTIAMDGCPWSKYDNKDLWQEYDYRYFDIIAEPYFDVDFNKVLYLTDTGRSWNGEKYNVRDKVQSTYALHFKSTKDIIRSLHLNQLPDQIMLTTHPQRWTNNYIQWTIELVSQSLKNFIKLILIKYKKIS